MHLKEHRGTYIWNVAELKKLSDFVTDGEQGSRKGAAAPVAVAGCSVALGS